MAHSTDIAHHGAEEETTTGLNHRKLLMWTFLGSDCLFFGALIATYMVYRGQSINGPYPNDILDIPITSISTFVLLMSSFGMVQALAATNRDDQKWIRIWLLTTVLLGLVFIGFQIYEFNSFKNEGLTLGTNLFSATFFTLTGFHGAHVALGVVWLFSLLILAWKGRLGPRTSLDLEIAGLYWHFVDIVWIVIFTLVYLIGGFDAGPVPTATG